MTTKVKLPKKIKIGCHDYNVGTVEGLVTLDEEPDTAWGLSVYASQSILLEKDMTKSFKREVLLHEILHCVMLNAGGHLGCEDEELVIRTIAPSLLAVLRENPELIEYLLEK
jgi:hypothetical protein